VTAQAIMNAMTNAIAKPFARTGTVAGDLMHETVMRAGMTPGA
jgi:hypothetical protein